MNGEDYYKDIEKKWQNEFPSTKNLDEVWGFYKECGYSDPRGTLLKILENVKWEKNKVLDLGCDTGFMLSFIVDEFSFLSGVGVDINSKAVEEAKCNFKNLKFEAFDGLNLPFKDKEFDLVFVSAVVKHVRYEDRKKFYSEIKRVSEQVFFIEADAKAKEEAKHRSWTFYNSHFEKEFEENFKPIDVIFEAGDILGLYTCG